MERLGLRDLVVVGTLFGTRNVGLSAQIHKRIQFRHRHQIRGLGTNPNLAAAARISFYRNDEPKSASGTEHAHQVQNLPHFSQVGKLLAILAAVLILTGDW